MSAVESAQSGTYRAAIGDHYTGFDSHATQELSSVMSTMMPSTGTNFSGTCESALGEAAKPKWPTVNPVDVSPGGELADLSCTVLL